MKPDKKQKLVLEKQLFNNKLHFSWWSPENYEEFRLGHRSYFFVYSFSHEEWLLGSDVRMSQGNAYFPEVITKMP